MRNNFERELNSADSKLWMEVFSQKAAGKTDGEIINWLINEGIEPEKAIDGIKDIEAIARNAYKKARKAMIASMLFIFGGLLLCGFSIQGSFNSTYLLYGVILFVTPLRFIYTNHKVYQLCEKVTEVLKGEKAEKN